MSLKDVLLAVTTYPEPTPISAVNDAVQFAENVGANISIIACDTKIRVPGRVHFIADKLIDIPAMAAAELKKSADNVTNLLTAFEDVARQKGVFGESMRESCYADEVPNRIAQHGRLRDLTIMPVPEGDFVDQWYAETVIFQSGRPTLVMPNVRHTDQPYALNTVAVAWDFSRTAARAVADSLPLLDKAKSVHVVTVVNEKKLVASHPAEGLAKYLARRGIAATVDEIDAVGRKIGNTLEAYIAAQHVDVLVMGAYGHSRVREFVLGGATKSMLARPPIPILMSH
jgi:nucleotide-binding universal stress UspA family protein